MKDKKNKEISIEGIKFSVDELNGLTRLELEDCEEAIKRIKEALSTKKEKGSKKGFDR